MFDKEITIGSFVTFAVILLLALGVAKVFPTLGQIMDDWASDRQKSRQPNP